MQSNEDLTLTEAPSQDSTKTLQVTVDSDGGKNLTIEVDGNITIIADNTTTDRELFEALRYEPFCKYTLTRGKHTGVRDEVFDEFYVLMDRIVTELNKIERE